MLALLRPLLLAVTQRNFLLPPHGASALRPSPHRHKLLVTVWAGLALTLCGVLPAASSAAGNRPREARMSVGQAITLGLVEGATEYLPVSSTGHLLLAQQLLGIGDRGTEKTAINAYQICIQAGAILAVLLLYAGRVRRVLAGVVGRDQMGRRLGANLVVAFLPAAVVGLVLEPLIKRYLFGVGPVVVAWLVGGLVILLVARRRNPMPPATLGRQLEQLTLRQALVIGVIQCVAMWPGVSRSLVTILGGLAVGLSVASAVEFSFLLGLVTLTAATLFEATKHGSEIVQVFGWVNPLLGFVVACLSAVAAVRWMVEYLNRHGLALFGYYRIALSALVTAGLLLGFMER